MSDSRADREVASKLLDQAQCVFWDFDGVIKDSVAVKTEAYRLVMAPYGTKLQERVVAHHQAQGGMSRFEKIPLYLEWAGVEANGRLIQDYCDRFASLVIDEVVGSRWAGGVYDFLMANRRKQQFVLVTATPDDEIRVILDRLKIADCFVCISGAPTTKADAMWVFLQKQKIPVGHAIMIGDTQNDLNAAKEVGCIFLQCDLTGAGVGLSGYDGPIIEGFEGL